MERILDPKEQCPCTLSAFIRLRALHMSRETLLVSSRPTRWGVGPPLSPPSKAASCV